MTTYKNTEYKCEDREILLGVYKKLLWNRMLPAIPASLTPNAITIVGQLCIVGAAFMAYAAAVMGQPMMYLVSAGLLLGYITADNLDGPHARATGQSSPLGEFLDHGLDGLGSGAVLLVAAFTLQISGFWMIGLCLLGALAWIVLFWDQCRTGILVIPAVSAVEGITILMTVQGMIYFLGLQDWMLFSTTGLTLGTVLILICTIGYMGTLVAPVYRAIRDREWPTDIAPALLIASSSVLYVLIGADAIVASVMVSVFSADIVARLILRRHEVPGTDAIVSPVHGVLLVPLALALLFPNLWYATGWALIAMGTTILLFTATLLYGATQLGSRRNSA